MFFIFFLDGKVNRVNEKKDYGKKLRRKCVESKKYHQAQVAKSYRKSRPKKPILNFDQIITLFDNIQGSANPISIVKEFTTDYLVLVHILRDIYPYLTERAIRTRCTKLKKNY